MFASIRDSLAYLTSTYKFAKLDRLELKIENDSGICGSISSKVSQPSSDRFCHIWSRACFDCDSLMLLSTCRWMLPKSAISSHAKKESSAKWTRTNSQCCINTCYKRKRRCQSYRSEGKPNRAERLGINSVSRTVNSLHLYYR